MGSVMIIGDSISNGYTPFVRELLAGKEIDIEYQSNGDSAQLLVGVPDWIAEKKLSLIHFNCGLHALRFFRSSQAYQEPLEIYTAHLGAAARWLKAHTPAKLVWASITPVITERITLDYIRFEKDVLAYNAAAKKIMDALEIPINDLHQVLMQAGVAECLGPDGVHMTDKGNAYLSQAVATTITHYLGM
ncbi:MAG: SGNH/GDSL hydrolase family protein [Chloroflexi bacterium]|nr:SGNH/GDSL hydrolase family protein [Chloroflexota bacterium]